MLASQSALAQNQRISHNASALRVRNYHPAAIGRPSVPATGPGMGDADGPEERPALLRTLDTRVCETHTGRGARGRLAAGGTMRVLMEEEIWHDPWEEAAALLLKVPCGGGSR